jgi:chaperonin GroES
MEIRPLRDFMVVEVEEPRAAAGIQLLTSRGIVDSQSQLGHRGKVLAVGPGKKDKNGRIQPMGCKVGDTVRFGEFAFKEWNEDGRRLMMIQDADVTGIEDPIH